MNLRFWKPRNPLEEFAKMLVKEFLKCYGFNQPRSFLSEVSQLAIEGLVLNLNEFLKNIAPDLEEFIRAGLKHEIERIQ